MAGWCRSGALGLVLALGLLALGVPGGVVQEARGQASSGRSLLIERFDATLEVEEDGWLDVRERIEVRFQGSWNGIFRDIPVEYRTPQGFSYRLFLDDVEVLDGEGRPLEYDEEWEGPFRRLRIRVPGAQDAVRTVSLHYRVPNGLRFQEDYDELYWNVTGDGWEMPIRRATAMVLLPEAAGHVRTAAWTGGYGSRENAAQVEESADGLFFETTEQLDYGEGLTIAVAWDPGVVDRPSAAERTTLFLRANWLFFLPLLSLAGMARLWWVRGKDPARRSVAARYEPPRGLRPAEAGTLLDNEPHMRDLTACLVDLAVRGWLRIEEVEEKGFFSSEDYRLTPLRPSTEWNDLEAHERRMLAGVFGSAPLGGDGIPDPVLISELKHNFYTEITGVRDAIFDSLRDRGFYDRRPDKVLQWWAIGGALAMVLGLGGGVVLAGISGIAPLTGVLAGVLFGLPILGFGLLMPARTVAGARAREEVLGFEEFLDRVESERYRRMIQGPEMFEAYLPYAMAFGVAERWARAFEGLVQEPPSWFVGSGLHPGSFHPVRFSQSLDSMSAATGAAMHTGPRSSGGSGFSGGGFGGGGGFSGGGFGGGGGGGW